MFISFDNGKDFIYERLLELLGIGLELPMQHLYCCALFDQRADVNYDPTVIEARGQPEPTSMPEPELPEEVVEPTPELKCLKK